MSTKLFALDGRIALVTGSSQGIGHAIAKGLAEAGAHVVLNGRDAAKLDKASGELRAAGLNASTAAFDVTDRAAIAPNVDRIEREIGPIGILVNNAGINRRAPALEFTEADWDAVLSTNLDSVFFLTQAVARHMVPRKRGKIINICSVTSLIARPTIPAYSASKGALKLLTQGLCAEWAKHDIQVNGIGPGYVRTPLNTPLMADKTFTAWVEARTPAGRWADPEEMAGAAVFLASDASSYVNGHVLMVDGGMTAVV